MPFNVGPIELIIVLVIALLVVGPRRLPEMGNAVGKTIREFRKASSDIGEAASFESSATTDEPKPNTLIGEAKPNTMSESSPGAAAAKPRSDDDA
jgi:TatA/E family protein of Tat protein translocase